MVNFGLFQSLKRLICLIPQVGIPNLDPENAGISAFLARHYRIPPSTYYTWGVVLSRWSWGPGGDRVTYGPSPQDQGFRSLTTTQWQQQGSGIRRPNPPAFLRPGTVPLLGVRHGNRGYTRRILTAVTTRWGDRKHHLSRTGATGSKRVGMVR